MEAAIGVAALEEEVVEVVGEMRCATRRALSTLTRARLVVYGRSCIQAVAAASFVLVLFGANFVDLCFGVM